MPPEPFNSPETPETAAERSSRRRELFDAAVELAPAAREAFLRTNIDNDPDLLDEIRSLLRYHETVAAPDIHPPSPPEYSLIGATIGGCRILRHLGSGGMGVVYEAAQDHPHRTVALKILRPGISSGHMLARIEHEAELLGRLCHPGIARIYGSGSFDDGHGGVPYFIMELIERALPLIEYADRHRLDTRERVQLMTQVCDAVHHGHERGVIHRDLKPGNILIDEHGEPRVIDFGVATTDAESDSPLTRLTRGGQMIGTLQYMSPEQVDSKQNRVDARTDVYGLGAVLYELLCSRPPIDLEGLPLPEAAKAICDTAPRPLSSADRTLRGDLETVCRTAMAKEPSRRYKSALAMSRDLQRWLHFEPITARPPSMLYLTGRFVRRHRAPVTFAAVLIMVLSAALVIVSGSLARESGHRIRIEQEQTRLREVLGTIDQSLDSIDHPEAGEAPLVAMLEEMTRQADAGTMSEPAAEAAVRRMVASVFRRSGRIPEAATQLAAAAELYETHVGIDDPETQRCLLDLADMYSDLDHGIYDPPLAAAAARKVLDWRSSHFGPSDPATMDALQSLAWSLRNSPNGNDVTPLYERLIRWLRSQPTVDRARLARNLLPYGLTLHRPGSMDQAVVCYREAATLAVEHLGPTHPIAIEGRTLQALALRDQQRFDEAALVYEEILPGLMERCDPGDPGLLRERMHYAMILARGGDGEMGLAELDAAIAQITPHVVQTHPSLVLARVKRLQLLLWSGRADEALRHAAPLWPLAHATGDLPRRALLSIAVAAAAVAQADEQWHHWMARNDEYQTDWRKGILRKGRAMKAEPMPQKKLRHVEYMVDASATGEHLMRLGESELARTVLERAVTTGRQFSQAPWLTARAELGLAALAESDGDRIAARDLREAALDRLGSSEQGWLRRLIAHDMGHPLAQGN
ncbi:MAG: serine/threonine-protein kinase [Phycisphaerales bacterium]|nr:serine/threonine-protein kinase [Phycisphaerales bacterium]